MTSQRLRIGTRGSKLARWQSRHVAQVLESAHAGLSVEEIVLKTDGDLLQEAPERRSPSDQGIFVRRIQRALQENEIDLAVHSLKDLPTDSPVGLVLAAIMARHDPRDALVTRDRSSLAELRKGARVGTGSFRRHAQILHLRGDLDLQPIRGNVDRRIAKLLDGEVDALILALAGLQRLGVDSVSIEPLDPVVCLPAVGQGSLAIESRADDTRCRELVGVLDHPASHTAAIAERAFLRRLGGGCLAPATAYAQVDGEILSLEAMVGSPDGMAIIGERERGRTEAAEMIGARLAERLYSAGAEAMLERARLMASDR